MPPRRSLYKVVNCSIEDAEEQLNKHSIDYHVAGYSAFNVGIGFGSYVNVSIVFRLKENPK